MARRENLKVAGLQFEDHGTCDTQFLAPCGPGFFREMPDHRLRLGQRHIPLEGVLGRYGLCQAVRNNVVVIDAAGQFAETHAIATETPLECCRLHFLQICDRLYVEALQLFFSHLADSRQAAYGKWRHKRIDVLRLADSESIP